MGSRGRPPSGRRNKKATKPSDLKFRATSKWKVEGADYYDRLSPQEQQWMTNFLDSYYNCDLASSEAVGESVKQLRENYKAQNRNWFDAVTRSGAAQMLDPVTDDDRERAARARDPRPSPEYLGTEEYGALLAEYRRLVDVPWAERTELQERRMVLLRDWMQSMAQSEPDPIADYLDAQEENDE